jgi:DNA helicase II / ATP-dependent DNA helicase PcrA
MKGTCLSIYSRCVNAELAIEEVLCTSFPWCAAWAGELRELFAAYVRSYSGPRITVGPSKWN